MGRPCARWRAIAGPLASASRDHVARCDSEDTTHHETGWHEHHASAPGDQYAAKDHERVGNMAHDGLLYGLALHAASQKDLVAAGCSAINDTESNSAISGSIFALPDACF